MFHKLVAIEPVSLIPSAEQELHQYAKEVTLYRDIPTDDDEIVRRIGDADAVLLSYTSRMGKKRDRALPEYPLHRHVLQSVFGGERQRRYRLCPHPRHQSAGHPGLRRPRRCGVRPARAHRHPARFWNAHAAGRTGGDHRAEGRHRRAGCVRQNDRRCAAVHGCRHCLLQPHPQARCRSPSAWPTSRWHSC